MSRNIVTRSQNANKRGRELVSDQQCVDGENKGSASFLALPLEVQELVFSKLDARSLSALGGVCKAFRVRNTSTWLRLSEQVAKDKLMRLCGAELAGRWRCVNNANTYAVISASIVLSNNVEISWNALTRLCRKLYWSWIAVHTQL